MLCMLIFVWFLFADVCFDLILRLMLLIYNCVLRLCWDSRVFDSIECVLLVIGWFGFRFSVYLRLNTTLIVGVVFRKRLHVDIGVGLVWLLGFGCYCCFVELLLGFAYKWVFCLLLVVCVVCLLNLFELFVGFLFVVGGFICYNWL